ncbi:MAG TPA: hypothetical protein VKU36_04250 [Candidatus Babeliales bacterium]|nr:hypothetical protein [Candidatus Babeliales bacterium]
MKKNMVIIKPLFIFPLITCISLSGMEQAPLHQELQNFIPFQKLKDRHSSGEYTESQMNIDLVEKINLIESTQETTTLQLPEFEDTYTLINPLLQSVILPTEEKEISWGELISYKISTASGHLQNMITRLEKNQFDAKNLKHINWLNEAIATATNNQDIQALLTIAQLYEKDEYRDAIRITPEVAQPASVLLNEYYTQQITAVDQDLLKERQKEMIEWNKINAACTKAIYEQINLYHQNMQSISKNYDATEKQQLEHISDLQRKMKAFGVLNREIRQETADLINNNQVKRPKHIFATTMKQTDKKLTAIENTLKEIPTIQTTQGNPTYLTNLLNLNNK